MWILNAYDSVFPTTGEPSNAQRQKAEYSLIAAALSCTRTQRKMNVFVVQLIYLSCYASLILTINLFAHLSYAVSESTAVQSFSCKALRIIACCVLHVVRLSLYYSYTLTTHFFPVLKIQKTEVNRRHTHATGKIRVKN